MSLTLWIPLNLEEVREGDVWVVRRGKGGSEGWNLLRHPLIVDGEVGEYVEQVSKLVPVPVTQDEDSDSDSDEDSAVSNAKARKKNCASTATLVP